MIKPPEAYMSSNRRYRHDTDIVREYWQTIRNQPRNLIKPGTRRIKFDLTNDRPERFVVRTNDPCLLVVDSTPVAHAITPCL
jgi:hypothetical protein